MKGQVIKTRSGDYTLTQQAHISHCGLWYTATAKDDMNNDHRVWWPIINPDAENEDETCDWTKFYTQKL